MVEVGGKEGERRIWVGERRRRGQGDRGEALLPCPSGRLRRGGYVTPPSAPAQALTRSRFRVLPASVSPPSAAQRIRVATLHRASSLYAAMQHSDPDSRPCATSTEPNPMISCHRPRLADHPRVIYGAQPCSAPDTLRRFDHQCQLLLLLLQCVAFSKEGTAWLHSNTTYLFCDWVSLEHRSKPALRADREPTQPQRSVIHSHRAKYTHCPSASA